VGGAALAILEERPSLSAGAGAGRRTLASAGILLARLAGCDLGDSSRRGGGA
jgi:hypothetical protein